MLYSCFKIVHFFSIIAWFASIFYLWRLFVYHAESSSEDVMSQLDIMSFRLYYNIMVPASILTIISGGYLLFFQFLSLSAFYWIWVKILCVLVLIGYQFYANKLRKDLKNRTCEKNGKFFRICNEVPTLILLIILILVVIRPF